MGFLSGLLKVAAPVGGFLLGGPAGAMAGSAIASGISGSEKGAKADKLREQQTAQAQQRFQAGAPFRQRLAELAKRPTAERPDLSALVADPGNPYARVAPRPQMRPTLAQAAAPQVLAPSRPTGGLQGLGGGIGRLFERARSGEQSGQRGNALGGFF